MANSPVNLLSIVTPTYNRAHILRRSLDASLLLVQRGCAIEIILVDDASTDQTKELVLSHYASELAQGLLVFEQLPQNQGVTFAKNRGAQLAQGEWIAFMDSDDNFIVDHAELLVAELTTYQHAAAVFFRCRDNHQLQLIGPATAPDYISLSQLINVGTPGECLPVIKRQVILKYPYPAELRGSESLAYFAMLASGLQIFISELIVREYDYGGEDRLSAKKGLRARADKLVVHNLKILKFASALSVKTLIGVLLRIAYYSWLNCLNKFGK